MNMMNIDVKILKKKVRKPKSTTKFNHTIKYYSKQYKDSMQFPSKFHWHF